MTTMEEEETKRQNGYATATAPSGPSESYAAMMDAKAEAQDMRDTIRENGGTGLSGMKARTYFDESASPAQNQPAQDWRAPEQTVAQKKPAPYADRTIVQTPNGRAVYFGSAAGAADAAKAAVQYANERQGIVDNAQAAAKDQYALKNPEDEKYRQSQIAELQRQGYNDRMQNGFRNDAIVTDAFAALYGQWKGTEAGEDGKSRAGLVRDALRDVNDRLADGGASYRVLGMSVVGKKDGDPVFRIVTTDRNGKRNVMTRSMDEVYNTRLNAYNGLYADASKGDEKTGAPSGNESRVISEFGDRRGVQKRYELINREQIERERANQAREKLTQDQLAESRRATDEANRMKALVMLRDFSANNGGRQMSEQQYMMKILGDPKARASYETVPEFETEKDRNGNTVVDSNGKPVYKRDASGNLIPAYETDNDGKPVLDVETGKPVQKTRTLSPDEVVKRVQDEYRSIMSGPGAQANGQSASNPFLEAMYKVHPEWRPKAENPATGAGAGTGATDGQKNAALEKLKARGYVFGENGTVTKQNPVPQNGQAAPSAQQAQTAPKGTISPVVRPKTQSAPTVQNFKNDETAEELLNIPDDKLMGSGDANGRQLRGKALVDALNNNANNGNAINEEKDFDKETSALMRRFTAAGGVQNDDGTFSLTNTEHTSGETPNEYEHHEGLTEDIVKRQEEIARSRNKISEAESSERKRLEKSAKRMFRGNPISQERYVEEQMKIWREKNDPTTRKNSEMDRIRNNPYFSTPL